MQNPDDVLGDRRKALEDAFFRERDQQLLDRLKLEMEAAEAHKLLAHVSGILDQQVLAKLVKAGVRAETLTALALIPMVEVAWADGAVSQTEREAVLKAAAENDLQNGTAAHELLDRWLRERPDVKMIAAWKEYVTSLAKAMPPEAVAAMRDRVIGRCRRVAEAAGGFLGLTGKVSKVEQNAIDEFERAFSA